MIFELGKLNETKKIFMISFSCIRKDWNLGEGRRRKGPSRIFIYIYSTANGSMLTNCQCGGE